MNNMKIGRIIVERLYVLWYHNGRTNEFSQDAHDR